ncbi:unnamed protein product [Calicophoron daubneyi]|uniref:RH2 domain-containing protein n=1 Tax=Calicophoron daubneyi TaxID=300641 RepID=A0AAV2TJY5_CALDB
MDQLVSDKQQLTVDLSMQVAEKNDVVFQLERAKKLRDVADKRVSSLEDELLVTKKAAEDKIERLESLLRHHEMLARNAKEHASRLEERDAQLQNELAIANDRYTELLRAHVDQLERIKLPYSDNASVLAAGAEATNQSEAKAEAIEQSMRNSDIRLPTKPDDDGYLKLDELPSTILLDPVKPSDKVSSFIDLMDEAMEYESVIAPSSAVDQEDDDEATHASEGTECAENSFGMVKEVEKLINENAELSATKNALNVVKNDLIRKLDDVTGEKLMLIKELEYLRANRDKNRNDVNRLVRQVNGYQKRVAYLSARLKLYEDVNESFELLPVSSTLSHATSCLVLNDSSCSANELRGSPATVTSANRFGGSLDRVNLTSNHYNPYNAIDAYEARHVNGESQYADRPLDQTREAVPNTPVSQAMCMAKMGEPYFTKREMARVISERNHYKEAFLELQESVRYMEDMRAQSSAEERPSNPC